MEVSEDYLSHNYHIRRAIPGAKSFEVTFPFEIVEREARRYALSLDEFLRRFRVEARFDSGQSVLYTLVDTSIDGASPITSWQTYENGTEKDDWPKPLD